MMHGHRRESENPSNCWIFGDDTPSGVSLRVTLEAPAGRVWGDGILPVWDRAEITHRRPPLRALRPRQEAAAGPSMGHGDDSRSLS